MRIPVELGIDENKYLPKILISSYSRRSIHLSLLITLTNSFLILASLIFSMAIFIFSAFIRASCSSLEILFPVSLTQELTVDDHILN